MLRFLKSNSQFLTLLIPIFGLILWLPVFLGKASPVSLNPSLLPIGQLMPWMTRASMGQFILSYVLIVLLGFYLIRLNTKFQFIRFRTQLPAVLIVLLLSPMAYYLNVLPILLMAFPLLFAIERTFDSFTHDGLAYEFIDASFLVSVASFIFLPTIFAHLLIIMILILLKNNTWREWTFTIIGGTLPFLIFKSLEYVFEWNYNLPFDQLFHRNFAFFMPTLFSNIYIGFILFLIVIASVHMVKTFGTKKIQSRKLFLSLFGLFSFGFLSMLLPSVRIYGFLLAIIPSAYLISHYLHLIRFPKIAEGLTIVLIVLILFQEFILFVSLF